MSITIATNTDESTGCHLCYKHISFGPFWQDLDCDNDCYCVDCYEKVAYEDTKHEECALRKRWVVQKMYRGMWQPGETPEREQEPEAEEEDEVEEGDGRDEEMEKTEDVAHDHSEDAGGDFVCYECERYVVGTYWHDTTGQGLHFCEDCYPGLGRCEKRTAPAP